MIKESCNLIGREAQLVTSNQKIVLDPTFLSWLSQSEKTKTLIDSFQRN